MASWEPDSEPLEQAYTYREEDRAEANEQAAQDEHKVRYIGSSRGDKRTIFYGYCNCGAGTTNSASPGSAERKLCRHARGDNSGMVRS